MGGLTGRGLMELSGVMQMFHTLIGRGSPGYIHLSKLNQTEGGVQRSQVADMESGWPGFKPRAPLHLLA